MKTLVKEKPYSNGEKAGTPKPQAAKGSTQVTTRSGELNKELMQVLFARVGVSMGELNAIHEKSVGQAREVAREYEKQSKAGNAESVRNLKLMLKKPMGRQQQQLFSGPAPWPEPKRRPDITIPALNPLQHALVHAKGTGSGWGINDDHSDEKSLVFNFQVFSVPIDGFYMLKLPVMISGTCFMIADSSWLNPKEAKYWVTSYASSRYSPYLDSYGDPALRNGFSKNFLEESHDHISRKDVLIGVNNHFVSEMRPVFLEAKDKIDIRASCTIGVEAKGDGAFAEINCSANAGGILCPGLYLWHI